MSEASPVDTSEGEPRLIGGRCSGCSTVVFPIRERCPGCASEEVESVLLPSEGTLWSWTIQGFAPPTPPFDPGAGEFEPFGVGYVELPGFLRVEARLTGDPAGLEIGMPVKLVTFEAGGETLYAFEPAGDSDG